MHLGVWQPSGTELVEGDWGLPTNTISGALANGRTRDRELPFKSILIKGVEWFGELGIFCARVFRAALAPPYELGELLRQCDVVGAKSLPLVALAGAATGV